MSIIRPRTTSPTPKPDFLSNNNKPERDDSPGSNSVEVIVRMRPLLDNEDEVVWEVDTDNNTIRSKVEGADLKSLNLSHPKYYTETANNQRFTYDNVEGPQSRTKDIYTQKLKKIVDSVVQGYNGTIFMYGQTSSGKTFSMLGNQKEPGILPHALRTIFMTIPKMKDYRFTISVSYLEIYNEVINDLLVPGSSNLKVIDDAKFGVAVKGLKRQDVATFDDAIFLMSYGEEHRKYRETNANEHSSRSHTIYQVFVESYEEGEDLESKRRFSCLNLVDLAGSERLSDNGGNDSQTGETGHINKSLFLLTNVIKKLADGKAKSHIPYRDSKLTRILSNAVGGNSLTCVICAISPALQNYAQTLSTLRFASRAKKVKNAATENLVQGGSVSDAKLKEEVKTLRQKLNQTEDEVSKVNNLNSQLEDNLQMTKQEVMNLQKEMEELKGMFFRETVRQQKEEDFSMASSLLDIVNDTGYKTLRLKNKNLAGEPFFGDPILAIVEKVINESGSTFSLENPPTENSSVRDWTNIVLAAKQRYLQQLKTVQISFVADLEEASSKFVSQEKTPEPASQIKGYIASEFEKIDTLQAKITEHLRRIGLSSLKELMGDKSTIMSPERKANIDWLPKEQAEQNGEVDSTTTGSEKRKPSDEKNHQYGEVLSNLEKKYNEIYSLITEKLLKGKEAEETEEAKETFKVEHVQQKNYNFDSSYCPSPNDSLNNSVCSDSGSPNEAPVGNQRVLDGLNKGRRNSDFARPSATSRFNPKESLFAKLRTEKKRFSICMVAEDPGYGNAFLWGSGKDGRLGNGKSNNEATPVPIRDLRFTKLVCGYHNTFGISQDGMVYGWGRNENGQLGVGNTVNTPIPVNVTGLNKLSIVDITCGWQHCLALCSSGKLFSWGCGDEGQLGHGDNFDLNVPAEIKFFEKTQVVKIAAGHSQSAAITSEGTLYTWGHNSDYRIMNSNPKSHFIPTLTELYKTNTQKNDEETQIVSLSMGATHMCAVLANGTVYMAGRGFEGQLGVKLTKDMQNVESLFDEEDEGEDCDGNSDDGSFEEILCSYFVQLTGFGADRKAVVASCGEKYTLLLDDKSRVYSFGDTSDGCLGIEYDEKLGNVYDPHMVEKLSGMSITNIIAGPRHAACVTKTGELYCWGFNYYEQLGLGELTKDYHIPKKVEKLAKFNVTNASCGYFHTVALVKNEGAQQQPQ